MTNNLPNYPILWPCSDAGRRRFAALGCPKFIPFGLIQPHAAQCFANHKQSLFMVRDRGGLSPSEALAIIEDRPWHRMPDPAAIDALNVEINLFTKGQSA